MTTEWKWHFIKTSKNRPVWTSILLILTLPRNVELTKILTGLPDVFSPKKPILIKSLNSNFSTTKTVSITDLEKSLILKHPTKCLAKNLTIYSPPKEPLIKMKFMERNL